MDLTWKDKLSFFITEFRRRLPFSEQTTKQNYLIGGIVCGVVCILAVIVVLFVKAPTLISSLSSKSAPLSSGASAHSPNTSASETSGSQTKTVPDNGAHTSYGQPLTAVQNNTQGNKNGNGTPSSSQTSSNTANYPPGTVVGQSQIVLQSGPTPTSNPQKAVIGTANLPTVEPYPSIQSGTGTPQPNVTQGIQPTGITWQAYFNNRDLYSIEYPVGWQAIKTIYNNHEGVALYPPNPDPNVGLQEIGFGISQFSYGMPGVTTDNASSVTDIMVDGYPGKLYTQGSFQSNTIAAVFKYGNNYFGIGGTTNNSLMTYVFDYMLSSLILYGGSY